MNVGWGYLFSFMAGLSGGLLYGVAGIRRQLSLLKKAGGEPRPPADLREEIERMVREEIKSDAERAALIERLKKALEGVK